MASIWQNVAGRPITDELLQWPPDLFALVHVVLERSQVYRFAFSPPSGAEWPPSRVAKWSDAVEEAGRQWCVWVENQRGPAPGLLTEAWGTLREKAALPLQDLARGDDWDMCDALLTLYTLGDEACAGLGLPVRSSGGAGCGYRARGGELLARTGSMARVPTHCLRVLPKARTAPSGTFLSSLARYACVVRPGVDVRWYKAPVRHAGTDLRADHASLLLLPWPLRVRESDFRPVPGSVQRMAKEPFGFFEFSPSEPLDLDLVSRVIVAAKDEGDSVDVVCLPESAIDESEVEDLEVLLESHGVAMLTTGVRQHAVEPERFAQSWVHIGVNPSLEKGGRSCSSRGEQWFHWRQVKHHRWSLDEGQVFQYHLGGTLHPNVRWWEAIEVPRRGLGILELGEEITIAALVCEDLANLDDVSEILRSVGPTLVVPLLLDGPQLSSRWAARYAGVLADNPGSAVCTLTSFGMVQRCRPRGRDASPVVALWKDPTRGTREIPLEAGAQGILLTTCGERGTRRSADGRWPIDNATNWFDVAIFQVRASSAGSWSPNSGPSTRKPPLLGVEELAVLTSFAQAVAVVLSHSPERVEELFANARAGAPWRAEFGLPEPSPHLSAAIDSMARAIHGAGGSGDAPALDAVLTAVQHRLATTEPDRSDAAGLDRLAQLVFRASLEQHHFRTIETSS
jgi:hypothetical protein